MTVYPLRLRVATVAAGEARLATPPAVAGQPRPLRSTSLARLALASVAVWMILESARIAASIVGGTEGGWLAAATAAAIMLSALVSSIAGFAFSAIAGSALAYLHVEPVRAVHMMVVCSMATQLYAVWSIRGAIRWRVVLPIAASGAITIPVGVWLLLHADASLYAAGLGAFLTAYGCYLALRRDSSTRRESVCCDVAAGALGGLTGGLAGIPGAPVTVWFALRGWDKLAQRAAYQPYILAMQVVTLLCLRWQAPSHVAVSHDVRLLPFALIGASGGLAIFRRMSNRQFQVAVSLLLLVSGLGLLVRAL